MNEDVEQTRRLLQGNIVRLAESRLERALSAAENKAIEKIESLMMLEAIEQSFSHYSATANSIEKELSAISQQAFGA
ncbi:MAG: hypothetical protein SF097_08270 [Acidobacteriota bacterium]|nr:hypothetical protein [Acidobacteriota bacterium]